jgi:hypothetical protein
MPETAPGNQGENDTVNPDAWLGKAEAADFLGVSVRQIEYRAARGEIRKREMPKARHERAARVVYSREDLDAIRQGEPKQYGPVMTPSAPVPAAVAALDISRPFSTASGVLALPAALIDALRERREPAPVLKPWLSLTDAAEYSGLPASFLLAQARQGAPWAINVGQGSKAHWRFNRDGLGAVYPI